MTGDSAIVTDHSGEQPQIGHDETESAVTFARNRRSRSIGMAGHDGPEYAGRLNVVNIGLDVRHGQAYNESQYFAHRVYHALNVDTIAYQSFFHGGLCHAVFDRGIDKFRLVDTIGVDENDNTCHIFTSLGIEVVEY